MEKVEEKNLKEKGELLKDHINKIEYIMIENDKQFESKITYLGAGAIALIFVFEEKHGDLYTKMLILGTIFVGLSLVINLSSALIFKYVLKIDQTKFDKQQKLLKSLKKDKDDNNYFIIPMSLEDFNEKLTTMTKHRNKIGDNLNVISFVALLIGFIFIMLYLIFNLK